MLKLIRLARKYAAAPSNRVAARRGLAAASDRPSDCRSSISRRGFTMVSLSGAIAARASSRSVLRRFAEPSPNSAWTRRRIASGRSGGRLEVRADATPSRRMARAAWRKPVSIACRPNAISGPVRMTGSRRASMAASERSFMSNASRSRPMRKRTSAPCESIAPSFVRSSIFLKSDAARS